MFVECGGQAGVQVSKMEFHTHTHIHIYIYIYTHTHRLGYGKISILYKKNKNKNYIYRHLLFDKFFRKNWYYFYGNIKNYKKKSFFYPIKKL